MDLKEDEILIWEYKKLYENVWFEIIDSIKNLGIIVLDIYCIGNRLFMIIEVDVDFIFEKKLVMDENNVKVQEWEILMWKF